MRKSQSRQRAVIGLFRLDCLTSDGVDGVLEGLFVGLGDSAPHFKCGRPRVQKEEMIAKIAVQTEGFTVITKSDCETLIQRITAMLEGGQDNV